MPRAFGKHCSRRKGRSIQTSAGELRCACVGGLPKKRLHGGWVPFSKIVRHGGSSRIGKDVPKAEPLARRRRRRFCKSFPLRIIGKTSSTIRVGRRASEGKLLWIVRSARWHGSSHATRIAIQSTCSTTSARPACVVLCGCCIANGILSLTGSRCFVHHP